MENAAHLTPVATTAADISLQTASLDIWDTKYRLKTKQGEAVDADIDGTYQRVAQALAEVESTPEKREMWRERFLWALRRGAIPADHKPPRPNTPAPHGQTCTRWGKERHRAGENRPRYRPPCCHKSTVPLLRISISGVLAFLQ